MHVRTCVRAYVREYIKKNTYVRANVRTWVVYVCLFKTVHMRTTSFVKVNGY